MATIRLAALLRLMASLGRTGRLVATNGPWILNVRFEKGSVVSAECGDDRGLAAVEACVYLFPAGEFVISDLARTTRPMWDISPAELTDQLRMLSAEHSEMMKAIPSLQAVPRVCSDVGELANNGTTVNVAWLALLRAVDGRLSVAELIGTRHPIAHLRILAQMIRNHVLEFAGSSGADGLAAPHQHLARPADDAANQVVQGALSLRPAEWRVRRSVTRLVVFGVIASVMVIVFAQETRPVWGQETADEARSWLDRPLVPWNTPSMPLPTAPLQPGAPRRSCPSSVRAAETDADRQLVDAGWQLVGYYTGGWGIVVIGATSSNDSQCLPEAYQGFVFVDGTFAGTVSPELMYSLSTGQGALTSLARDALVVRFQQYAAGDPECCPSRPPLDVDFEVRRGRDGPVVVPLRAVDATVQTTQR